jgi:negative regulator of replication initiation
MEKFKDVASKEQQEIHAAFSPSKRRLQEVSNDAPISKHHTKKRKAFLKQQQEAKEAEAVKQQVETAGRNAGRSDRSSETASCRTDKFECLSRCARPRRTCRTG